VNRPGNCVVRWDKTTTAFCFAVENGTTYWKGWPKKKKEKKKEKKEKGNVSSEFRNWFSPWPITLMAEQVSGDIKVS